MKKFEIDDWIWTRRTERTKTKAKIFYLSRVLTKEREIFFRKIRKILRIVETKTLKQLAIIVTELIKSYFVVLEITKFTELKNESNRARKSRILLQINEIFVNLFKYRKVFFLLFISSLSVCNLKDYDIVEIYKERKFHITFLFNI